MHFYTLWTCSDLRSEMNVSFYICRMKTAMSNMGNCFWKKWHPHAQKRPSYSNCWCLCNSINYSVVSIVQLFCCKTNRINQIRQFHPCYFLVFQTAHSNRPRNSVKNTELEFPNWKMENVFWGFLASVKKKKKNIGFYFPALPRFTFLMKSNYKLMLFKRRGSQPSAICIFKYGIHHTGNSFGFFFAVPS